VSAVDAGRTTAAQASARTDRWIPAAVFVATLVVASVLLFLRVRTTAIELGGTFSGLGFVSAREQPLNHPFRVTALGAAGLKSASLPDEVTSQGTGPSAIRVSIEGADESKSTSSILVDRIVVPEGATVWLSRGEAARQYRISIRSATPVAVHADVTGTASFAPANAPATTVALRAPRAVDLTGSTGVLDVDVTLAAGSPAPRWQQLVVRDLRLHRVEDERDAAHPLARPVPTVLSGSLFLESLGGDERRLRDGEMLRFGASSGTIITLALRDDAIAATFQGDVRDMRLGSGEHPRSLMPTLLEWLRKREGLSLLWGTALYLFGITVTLRRWWGRAE
jgi:hypothetical protein